MNVNEQLRNPLDRPEGPTGGIGKHVRPVRKQEVQTSRIGGQRVRVIEFQLAAILLFLLGSVLVIIAAFVRLGGG